MEKLPPDRLIFGLEQAIFACLTAAAAGPSIGWMREPRPDDVIVARARGGAREPPGDVWVVRQSGRELARFPTEADALDFGNETAALDEVDLWRAEAGRQATWMQGYR